MRDETTTFERILDILDQVITKMESMHTPSRDFGTGVPLYRKEIHTIQAIGQHPRINVTALAEHMGLTKGAVSQTIAKLVRKGLVRKTRPYDNAREVILELTDLGWIGFQNHEQFHMHMFDIVREYFGSQLKPKLDTFATAMTDLNEILDKYEQRKENV